MRKPQKYSFNIVLLLMYYIAGLGDPESFHPSHILWLHSLQCRDGGWNVSEGKGHRVRGRCLGSEGLRTSDRGRCSSLLSLSCLSRPQQGGDGSGRVSLRLSLSVPPLASCENVHLPRLAGGHFRAQTQEVTRIKQLQPGQCCRTGQLPSQGVPWLPRKEPHTDKTGLPGHCGAVLSVYLEFNTRLHCWSTPGTP